jgi:hypothetical protein
LLTTTRSQQIRRALAASVLLAVVLVAAWVLAQFPGIRAWLRLLWPEQIILLGCLLWQALGPHMLLAFLILLGVCARLLYLGQWLLRRFRSRVLAVPEGAAGPPEANG